MSDGDGSRRLNFAFLLTNCLIGLTSNVLSAIVLSHNRVFRNPFGYLNILNTIGNTGVLLVYTFWISPILLLNCVTWDNFANRKLGQIALFFCELAFHSCLFISINRLMAISSPYFYRRYFTNILTAVIIVFICILVTGYTCVYFIDGCDFSFDTNQQTWWFSNTECGFFLAFYVDLYYNVALFVLIMVLDCITLTLLRRASVRLESSSNEARRRGNREIRFFFQAFTNTLVFVAMEFSFHVLGDHCDHTDGLCQFLTTPFAWAVSHACSGVILVVFNREIRRIFITPSRIMSLLFETKSSTVQINNNLRIKRSEETGVHS